MKKILSFIVLCSSLAYLYTFLFFSPQKEKQLTIPDVSSPYTFELYVCEKGKIACKEYWITQDQVSFMDSTFQQGDKQRNHQFSIHSQEALMILDSLNKLGKSPLRSSPTSVSTKHTEAPSFTFTWNLNGKLHTVTVQNEEHSELLELVAIINNFKEIPKINYDESYFESFS
ncbi:MAG: hypothetical protein MK212_10265 [Saprospiraceae bacterium]|nr:hypothetical protein [Saprospiraceae bacterium]